MNGFAEVRAALDDPSLSASGWALAHCAQSIELSLTGFPEPKPAPKKQLRRAANKKKGSC